MIYAGENLSPPYIDTTVSFEKDSLFRSIYVYVQSRCKALDGYVAKAKRQQRGMLARLARIERRMLKRLKRTDSLAYAQLAVEKLTFDSICNMADIQTGYTTLMAKRDRMLTDSLLSIQTFIPNALIESSAPHSAELVRQSNERIQNLKQSLAYREQLRVWSEQRMELLIRRLGSKMEMSPLINQCTRTLYYTQSRVEFIRNIADDPDRVEEQALEYLQGMQGFDEAVSRPATAQSLPQETINVVGNPNSVTPSFADLEAAGMQTKGGLQTYLNGQMGNGANSVQQLFGENLQKFQRQIASVGDQVKDLRDAARRIGGESSPAFRINPMRGRPFLQRLEHGVDVQTVRPSGAAPGLLVVGGFAGFKQDTRLVIGAGGSLTLGTGYGLRDVHISVQGVALRTYVRWDLIWGIGVYASYERGVSMQNALRQHSAVNPTLERRRTNGDVYLLGIQKRYKISRNWNGAVQLSYDLEWRDRNLPSPIIFRILKFQ